MISTDYSRDVDELEFALAERGLEHFGAKLGPQPVLADVESCFSCDTWDVEVNFDFVVEISFDGSERVLPTKGKGSGEGPVDHSAAELDVPSEL